jgi:hypothetical protein
MKSRIVSILAILALLLTALPVGLASAVQGEVTIANDAYTAFTSGGDENLVTLTIADEDLNVADSLTGDFEILGVADGSTETYTTDENDINSVAKVFDLQTGTSYFTSVSEANTTVTLHTARAQNFGSAIHDATPITASFTAQALVFTGADAPTFSYPIAAVAVKITDIAGGASATTAGLVLTIVGTEVNPSTLVAGASGAGGETLTFATIANAANATMVSTKFYLDDGTLTIAGGAATVPAQGYSIDVYEATTIAIRYTFDIVDSTDYLDDDSATQQAITLKSTSDPTGIELTATETSSTSGSFSVSAALIDSDDKEQIDNTITTASLDVTGVANNVTTAGDAVNDDIDDLIFALNALSTDAGDKASAWITDTISDLNATTYISIAVTDDIDALQAMYLEVSHDDVLSAVYADQSTSDASDTDTADIDLEAPVISGVYPAEGTYTDDESPTFTATFVDAGTGIDLTTLDVNILDDSTSNTTVHVCIPGGACTVSTDPVTDGYDMTFIGSTTQLGATPGTGGPFYDWSVLVKDAVGNVATTDDDDNTGANGLVSALDMIRYTIDSDDPSLVSAVTGWTIELDADDEDSDNETDDYIEVANAEWIKLTFSESLDQDSLSTDDFDVTGADEPTELLTSGGEDIYGDTTGNGVANANLVDLKLVYIKVGTIDPDATPEVEVVDDIDDLAGNDVDEDDAEAADGIAPTLTVAVSDALGADEDEVTITMTSNEDVIAGSIAVVVRNEVAHAASANSGNTSVGMIKGSGNNWSGTFEIGHSTVYTITANADDEAENAAEEVDTTFEGDIAAAAVVIADSGATALHSSTHTEEGSVWIVVTYDEDEYADDTFDEVTVTSVSLLNEADEELAGDVTALMSDDNIVFTLAVDLVPGDYEFDIVSTDSAGNETSGTADFEVIERDPFDLDLSPGVNLVSIPGTPSGDAGALTTLFADTDVTSVLTYDAAVNANGGNPWLTSTKDGEGVWSGDIASLVPGKSYFIETSSSATVEILLEDAGVEVPPSVALYKGWNAVGFWSISGDAYVDLDSYLSSVEWSVAYSYDPTPGAGWKTLRGDAIAADGAQDGSAAGNAAGDSPTADPGRGYLVYATADGTLTP